MTNDSGAEPMRRIEWQQMIRKHQGLPLATKGVAYTLSLYASYDGRDAAPGTEQLSRDCGIDGRQVRRHLVALLREHVIEQTGTAGRPGAFATYRLVRAGDGGESAAAHDEDMRLRAVATGRDSDVRKRCAVYRHWAADGVLLYVGVSVSTESRRVSHVRHATWARFADSETVQWLGSVEDALIAEGEAIASERPIFNRAGADEGAHARRMQYLVDHEAWDLLRVA